MSSPCLVGLAGSELLEEERELLRRHRPAGVILFRRNVQSADSLRALTDAVQQCLAEDGAPAIVAADHEGGAVSVLSGAIGAPPAPLALGLADDPSLTREVHEETARRLRAVGVHLALAPVCDLVGGENAVLATRSFGSTPAQASPHLREALAGLHAGGVAACAKHWPGHGRPREDSHLEVPVVEASLDDFLAQEMPPFVELIEAGVDSIMAAHLRAPALDASGTIASCSAPMLRDWLRDRLGFQGILLSDAVEMSGFVREPAIALEAGLDLLVFARPIAECAAMIAELPATVRDSRERVERFRAKLTPAEAGPQPMSSGSYDRARERGASVLWPQSRVQPAWPPTEHRRWRLIDAVSGDRLVREADVAGLAEVRAPTESTLSAALSGVLGPPAAETLLLPPPGRGDALAPQRAASGSNSEVDLCVLAALRPWSEEEWRRVQPYLAAGVGYLLLGDLSTERRLPADRGLLLVPGIWPEDARIAARMWCGQLALQSRGRW